MRKRLISLGILCFLLISTLVFFLHPKITMENDLATAFSKNPSMSEITVIESSEEAVKLAKAVIQNIYGESWLLHNKFSVYYDSENSLYYVTAHGRFLHPDAYMILCKHDGSVKSVTHQKF